MTRRRRPRRPAAFDHGEPIGRIELLPVTGVLLVAAVSVIATLPPPINAFVLDLPPPFVAGMHHHYGPELPTVHAVTLDAQGQLAWDGEAVSQAELAGRIYATQSEPRAPGITFEADGNAPYGAAFAALGVLHVSNATSWRFCLKDLARHQRYEERTSEQPAGSPSPDEVCEQALEFGGMILE